MGVPDHPFHSDTAVSGQGSIMSSQVNELTHFLGRKKYSILSRKLTGLQFIQLQ